MSTVGQKFWEANGINCFDRWSVPYFLEREKEKKRPCLRLNYPPDGKCNDCTRGNCRYDKICFMCGLEGHGAFQSFPGGKMKGEYKCEKHRKYLHQLDMIKLQHGLDEDDVRALFKLTPTGASSRKAATVEPTSPQNSGDSTAEQKQHASSAASDSATVSSTTSKSPNFAGLSESNTPSEMRSLHVSPLMGGISAGINNKNWTDHSTGMLFPPALLCI